MPLELGAAVAFVAGALKEAARTGRGVLVLDQRPGRVVSRAYRELLACLPRGEYATPEDEGGTLATLARPGQPLGIDLERTGTLLSFGAPVLAGWGRPGRMLAARRGLRVVQLDTWRSPSAALADEWLPIRPGSEGAVALALAHVVVSEGLVEAPAPEVRRLIARFHPARVAPSAGVEAQRLAALARSLVSSGPTAAVGGGDPGGGPLAPDDERAIALLDVLLGSVGKPGGIVARGTVPEESCGSLAPERQLREVPDGGAGLLILDAVDSGRALPWAAVERKLAPDALVVSLSPFASGLARRAHVQVPAPAPLEGWDEVLPTADATAASYWIGAPLVPPPPGATDPVELLRQVAAAAGIAASATGSHEDLLRRRAEAIHASGRGRVLARTEDGFREQKLPDASAAWRALRNGGCWIDDAVTPAHAVATAPSAEAVEGWLRGEAAGRDDLPLVAFAARGASGGTPACPVLTKLYQETELRCSVASVAVSPLTAREHGLRDGSRVRLESAAGAVTATLRCDPTLPPGRAALATGPDPAALHGKATAVPQGALALIVVGPDLTWRGTRVAIREA
jgi:anaerobic selenocysteine-containing dehydrogenase